MCKRNSGSDPLPQALQLSLGQEHIAAANTTYQDNKGAEWSVCASIGLQVGDYVELRDNIVRVLVERGVPTATITNAFGLSGREVWQIVAADPISLFRCLECGEPLTMRDRRDAMRMQRALEAVRNAELGGNGSADVFCGVCIEGILERLNEQARRDRLASKARIWELNKMSYQVYLRTPEWRATKAAALAWARYRCQLCNAGEEELHVHHRAYTRRGCERLEDLIVLCGTHHRQFHRVMRDAS